MKVTTVSWPEENCNKKFETTNSQEDISYTLYIVVETCWSQIYNNYVWNIFIQINPN